MFDLLPDLRSMAGAMVRLDDTVGLVAPVVATLTGLVMVGALSALGAGALTFVVVHHIVRHHRKRHPQVTRRTHHQPRWSDPRIHP